MTIARPPCNTKAVYTAIFGDRETVKPALRVAGYDCVLFTARLGTGGSAVDPACATGEGRSWLRPPTLTAASPAHSVGP